MHQSCGSCVLLPSTVGNFLQEINSEESPLHGFAAALAFFKPERLKVDKARNDIDLNVGMMKSFYSLDYGGGGGSVNVVSVVVVKLEGASADAVRALKNFVLCRVSTEI
ncbi:hypothetical protein Tco_0666673 [Tanacetum coccineum]